jgi:hypothetical protein
LRGTVAPGGDHQLESFPHGFGCQASRIFDGRRFQQGAARTDFGEVPVEAPGFVAFGGWIEDDAGAHAAFWGESNRDSPEESSWPWERPRDWHRFLAMEWPDFAKSRESEGFENAHVFAG